ncbi:MAG: carboxypeptidase-like regulatory domain-containing protein [bacterium]
MRIENGCTAIVITSLLLCVSPFGGAKGEDLESPGPGEGDKAESSIPVEGEPTQQETGWIEGIVAVKDEEGNLTTPRVLEHRAYYTRLLAGDVVVYQEGKRIKADTIDRSGIFAVDDLKPGTYDLVVAVFGCKAANIRGIEVKGGEPTVLEIVISEKGAGWAEIDED